jgi:hypothetical protein
MRPLVNILKKVDFLIWVNRDPFWLEEIYLIADITTAINRGCS